MADSRFAKAAAYERPMGRWSERVAPLFLELARSGDAGRILDVRCGTGALVEAVAGRTGPSTIVGIDPSQTFIAYARQRFPDSRFSCSMRGSLKSAAAALFWRRSASASRNAA